MQVIFAGTIVNFQLALDCRRQVYYSWSSLFSSFSVVWRSQIFTFSRKKKAMKKAMTEALYSLSLFLYSYSRRNKFIWNLPKGDFPVFKEKKAMKKAMTEALYSLSLFLYSYSQRNEFRWNLPKGDFPVFKEKKTMKKAMTEALYSWSLFLYSYSQRNKFRWNLPKGECLLQHFVRIFVFFIL